MSASCLSHEWVMSYIRMSHILMCVCLSHESCLSYHCIMSLLRMSHVTHMHTYACLTFRSLSLSLSWAMSLIPLHHVPPTNESCHSYAYICMSHIPISLSLSLMSHVSLSLSLSWVMSLMQVHHVSHMNARWQIGRTPHVRISHVSNKKKWYLSYEYITHERAIEWLQLVGSINF